MSHSFVANPSQRKLAEYCRSGEYDAAIGISSDRASVYRELTISAIDQALIEAFPITHQLLTPYDWDQLVTHFFSSQECHSPSILKMPKSLADFVKQQNWSSILKIPYLSDLIDFEWMEREIYMMPDAEKKEYGIDGDLLQDTLYVNPEHRFQQFNYPIFLKNPIPIDTPKDIYHIFCFRHPKTCQVQFISLSPFYRMVMEFLVHEECSGREAIVRAAEKFPMTINAQLFETARGFYQDLLSQDAILGFQQ